MTAERRARIDEILERLESASEGSPRHLALLSALKGEVAAGESDDQDLNEQLQAYRDAYEKLTAPANRLGTLLQIREDGTALVNVNGSDYVVVVDEKMEDRKSLASGATVLLNEAYAIVGLMEDGRRGSMVKVSEARRDGRLRVGSDQPGAGGGLIIRSDALADAPIKAGDEVRLDESGTVALEHFPGGDNDKWVAEEVPDTPWSAIGGQKMAVRQIKEAIFQPTLHPELYTAYDKKPVKGVLLYGPPGCGKTLIGKAIAHNLAKEYSERQGREVKECFLHISGPKILNMWLGETERMVRDIFATAREKAADGQIAVIFIDEAESVLRTRSGGRFLNINNTVVPQFCAEMDGLNSLENVVLVLTSNRPDYIDPAVLRPERIDRKVKVGRPDRDSSREILSIYLTESLPMHPDEIKKHDGEAACVRKAMIEATLSALWRADRETEFLRISYRSGVTETLHWHDMVSGALLKSVVDRAKDKAIRRALKTPDEPHGLMISDLTESIADEFRENEIFPKSDVMQDWLKLIDVEPEMVAAVRPIRADATESLSRKGVI